MFLGELIINLEIELDKFVDYDCGDCCCCLDVCLIFCLIGDGLMNVKCCLLF